jgi:hypothetical protein
MTDLNKILEETLDSIWSNKQQYTARSQAPRKDFAPMSSKDGYSYPYQSGADGDFPPPNYQVRYPDSMPWPLQTINTDLADGFVYVIAAANKISQCLRSNSISLTNEQRSHLTDMFKKLKIAINSIKDVGLTITDLTNMATVPPPQIPLKPNQQRSKTIK